MVVQSLADNFRDGFVHLHNGGLVTAAVAVVRRAEDCTNSLNVVGRGRYGQVLVVVRTDRSTDRPTAERKDGGKRCGGRGE